MTDSIAFTKLSRVRFAPAFPSAVTVRVNGEMAGRFELSDDQALLVAAWSIAMLGVPFKIWWLDAPVWVSTGVYLAMGYMSLLAAAPLAAAVPASGLAWLVAGGLAYTVGAIIFSRGRPDPWPGRFGHHEIWHLLVLTGSACHFAFMILHVAA